MVNLRRIAWLVFGVLVAIPVVSFADEQISGIGGVYWAHRQAVTTIACITRANGDSNCALFPAGDSPDHRNRVTVVTTDAPGRCCFAGESALAISANFSVTDAGGEFGTGQGACFAFESAGQEVHVRPDRMAMVRSTTAGTRRGLCTTKLVGSNAAKEPDDPNAPDGAGIYYPCDANADCSALSLGTCNLGTAASPVTTDQYRRAGMVMNCVCTTGTCNFSVRKEYVPR